MIKIGFLGFGQRGQQLYPLLSNDSRIEVSAIADPEIKKITAQNRDAVDMLAGSSAQIFEDFGKFLESELKAIIIATPDWLHEEQACAALSAGKDVFLEKPMAITPEGCDRILETAKKSGKMLFVGHNLRYFTVLKKLYDLIAEGAIGEIKTIWCNHYISYGFRYFQRWHHDPHNIGGLLIHKGVHDIDLIQWLAGERVKRVVAMGGTYVFGQGNVEDGSTVCMTLNNGIQATYQQCHFAHTLAAREYTIFGSKGMLRNSGDHPSSAVVQLFTKRWAKTQIPAKEWRFPDEEGFHGDADKRITQAFIAALEGKNLMASPEAAAWAVKAAYWSTQSLRKGNIPIDIPETSPCLN